MWASEPLLDGPVAMAFGDGEKIYVLESPVFPPDSSQPTRTRMLEDTNGDGLPDRAATIAGGKSFPRPGSTTSPEGETFATDPRSHVQVNGRSISDHGESAVIFPITVNPIYPILTEPDRTTSTTGIVFYSNSKIPGFERALLIAEPVHNLVHSDLLAGAGPTLQARRAREDAEFLASADPLFRPVGFCIGPDGSLYVVDFHASVAAPTELLEVGVKPDAPLFRASGKGRIYRITASGRQSPPASPQASTPQHPASLPSPAPADAQPMTAEQLQKIISDPTVQDTAQAAAVQSLGNLPGEEPAVFLLSKWRNLTAAPRAAAVEAIFRGPARIKLLLDQLEKELIPLWCLDSEHRVRLLKSPDAELAGRTRKLLEAHDPNKDPAVKNYESALSGEGNKEAGEIVYRRLCGRCHTYRGGSNYGPDLWTVSSRPPRQILINILLPSESIVPGRELYMIDLKSGGSVDGVIGSQNETSIFVLHDESRQETVLRQDVQRILLSDASAMPVELASQISVKEMADLIRYLTSRF